MKRDMNLVRQILLALEERGVAQRKEPLEVVGFDNEALMYHLGIMYDAGLINAIDCSTRSGPAWHPVDLTWAGHDFLDAARDEGRWTKVMTTVGRAAGSVTFDGLKAILAELAKQTVVSALP